MAQTHRHPDGNGDSMTESAQWGRFSENLLLLILIYCNFANVVIYARSRMFFLLLAPASTLFSPEGWSDNMRNVDDGATPQLPGSGCLDTSGNFHLHPIIVPDLHKVGEAVTAA